MSHNHSIKVYVIEDKGKKNLMMRYKCPVTRKTIKRSTGTPLRKEAIKVAAKWEAELESGAYKPSSKTTWEEFRECYVEDHLTYQSMHYVKLMGTVFNSVERICRPEKLSDLTAESIEFYQRELLKRLKKPSVRTYAKHLKAALVWAHKRKMLHAVPRFEYVVTAKQAAVPRGRSLKLEEFERMLAKTAKVVGEKRAPSFKFLLRGLWRSGLRIGEAAVLSWDDSSTLMVDLDGRRPKLRIPPNVDKSREARVCPLTPDFARLLEKVPRDQRRGNVFKVLDNFGRVRSLTSQALCEIISEIGRAAGVKVKDGRHATAHDLRRSFGTKWAKRLMPVQLKELMRHADIETTMAYYVDLDADELGDMLYRKSKRSPFRSPSRNQSRESRRKPK